MPSLQFSVQGKGMGIFCYFMIENNIKFTNFTYLGKQTYHNS